MDCIELVELLTDYLEGRLPAEDTARLEAHVAECDDCALYVEQMRRTVAALGSLDVDALSPQVQERLLDAFRGLRSG